MLNPKTSKRTANALAQCQKCDRRPLQPPGAACNKLLSLLRTAASATNICADGWIATVLRLIVQATAKGVAGGYRAENIARNTTATGSTYLSSAEALVKQWMNSPGHRANILNPRLTRLGCGAHACRCPKFHLLATQNFASAAP